MKHDLSANIMSSHTHKITTGCGTMYLTVCGTHPNITNIIVKLGKSGGCAQAQVEAIANLLSASIKAGMDPLGLANMMIGIRCSSPIFQYGEDVLSCADAIGKFLKMHVETSLTDANPAEAGLEDPVEMQNA